jgi:hypothetical protein
MEVRRGAESGNKWNESQMNITEWGRENFVLRDKKRWKISSARVREQWRLDRCRE